MIHVSAPMPKRPAAILMCAPSIVSGTTGSSGAHVARAAMVELARNCATRNGTPGSGDVLKHPFHIFSFPDSNTNPPNMGNLYSTLFVAGYP